MDINMEKDYIDISRGPLEWLFVEARRVDTLVTISQEGDYAQISLTWVEAQALHRWLGDRLGQ